MTRHPILLSATLAVGLGLPFALPSTVSAEDNPAQEQKVSDEERQKQIADDLRHRFPADSVHIADRAPIEMRIAINRMVAQSLQPEKLNEAFTQLTRVNRNRLGDVNEDQRKALDQEIKQFKQAYQAKYNQPFDIETLDLFQHAALVRAEVKKPDAIGRLPLRPIATAAKRDAAQTGDKAVDDNSNYGASVDTFGVNDQSKLGLMGLPPGGGVPRFLVTAIEQSRPGADEMAGEWRIIIPVNLNADLIAQNLTQHLRDLRMSQDTWPADPDIARDTVGRRVLMAYYNIDPVPQRNQPK